MKPTLPRLTAALLVTLMAAGACSSGSSGDSSAGAATSQTRADSVAAPAPAPAKAATSTPEQPAIISTGTVTLRAADVAAARTDVQRIADRYDGDISQQETTVGDGQQASHARLVLRIPAASFARAMADLEQVGDLEDSRARSKDVTTQVIDVDERVKSARASLARIRALLGRAEKIGDVLAIESRLASREADLNSLLAQHKHLADQTALSTITVTIDRREVAPTRESSGGFVSGLEAGWHGLTAAATAVVTVVGALLPWLPVLLVVTVPTWLLARRRRLAATAGPAE
ncbi:DUF4349 domain-containing protein [Nocardioides sp. DS6]|uniref:DUF4349 domain-containing protein n=1 Tax=Nocardioides eburneus TaxID=3231482 RepID=A0ABV3T438_9ACTN